MNIYKLVKLACSILFLFTIHYTAFSQKIKIKPYGSISAQAGFFKENGILGGADLNLGLYLGKSLGLGAGIEMLKIKDMRKFFYPLYLDIKSFTNLGSKYQVIFSLQPGYGHYFYNEAFLFNHFRNKGGFYFSSGLGVKFNQAIELSDNLKISPIVNFRYNVYHFKTYVVGNVYNGDLSNNINAFTVNFGIAL